MIDIGVAKPKAHGHAIIRTATAETRPYEREGSGPQIAQDKKETMAIRITTGTKYPATISAYF
jgi:hypothetical protein|tara:strand:- start:67 stop:255 length:189 start_codon:yes stop_codon:yes gene_type:complete